MHFHTLAIVVCRTHLLDSKNIICDASGAAGFKSNIGLYTRKKKNVLGAWKGGREFLMALMGCFSLLYITYHLLFYTGH